jgi:glycosyltransferase involved in cell wall biosynthesis
MDDMRRRIAIVVPGGVDRSGERRVIPAVLALLERLAKHFDVDAFALSQEAYPAQWDLLGARIHNIGAKATRPRAIAAILREHRRRRFALVHSIFSGACGLVGVVSAKLLRLPSLVHVAGGELAALPDIHYGGLLTARGRISEMLTLRGASLVSAASEPMIASIARHGIAARRITLGVDLSVWPSREPQRRDAAVPARLLHVASINRVKDQRTLLRTLSLLQRDGRSFHVDIVGEDTLHGELQALAAHLELSPHITFHGFRTLREWRALAERAHLLLVSSRHEAGPLVVLEAAIAGVPTVGTSVGHIAEWAPHAALAVPIGDAAELAVAVARLLDDEDLRLRIATHAQERALRDDADRTALLFERAYDDLLRSERAARVAEA